MYSISRLYRDQEELRAVAAELTTLCSQPHPPERTVLRDTRWRLARALLRHLPLKDRMVYSRLRHHPDPAVVAIAVRYSDEAAMLFGQFEAHTERWTPEAVEAEWPTYCLGAKMMAQMLDERIAREEAELLPHLDGAPEVPAERRAGDRNWAGGGWRIRELLGIDPPSPNSRAA